MEPRLALESYIVSLLRPHGKGVSTLLGEGGACLGTRTGKARTANQDRILFAHFDDQRGEAVDLCVLCDGMGGMESGDRCAEVGIATFLLAVASAISSGRDARAVLYDAADRANRRLYNDFGGRGGTTLAALMIHHGSAFACSVGDSRIFGLRSDGLRQLTRDDTIRGALDASGRKAPNGAARFAEHERLVQFLGMGGDFEPHVFALGTAEEYRLLLACSDGAYRPPGDMLTALASNASTPKQLVERLLALTEWLGGPDDASAIVIDSRMITQPVPQDEPLHGIIRLWGAGQAGVLMNVRRDAVNMAMAHQLAHPQPPPWTAAPAETTSADPKGRRSRGSRKKKRTNNSSLPLKSPSGDVVIEVGAADDPVALNVDSATPSEEVDDVSPQVELHDKVGDSGHDR
jgi:serine/threonine protein phosphatase PrpC